MDRRIVVIVLIVALMLALLLGSLSTPDTEVAGQVAPEEPTAEVAPEVPATRPVMPRPPPRPMQLDKRISGEDPRLVVDPGMPFKPSKELTPLGVNREDPEARREYRCRALGQQADLIDRLMVVGAGTGVDEEQRVRMVSRVAQLSTRVFDEGEALWQGELSCDGIASVNLSKAADFLATQADLLELDDKTSAEVNQALGVLDTVDWDDQDVE